MTDVETSYQSKTLQLEQQLHVAWQSSKSEIQSNISTKAPKMSYFDELKDVVSNLRLFERYATTQRGQLIHGL